MGVVNLREFHARSSDEDFIETELGKAVALLPRCSVDGPWLAGGSLRRMLLGQRLESDLDFFFRNETQLASFRETVEDMGLEKKRETEHHVHYRGMVGDTQRDVQCIRFAYSSSADAVVDRFDFTICQFAYDGERLTVGEHALWDLGRKRLAVHKITYPVSSMRRLLKYGAQGFVACNGAIAAILRQTAERPELQAALDIAYVD